MAQRIINHPDVEIREVDRSQVSPSIVGTHALVMGFSSKGEKFNPRKWQKGFTKNCR